MILPKTHSFFIALLILSGVRAFSAIKPSAASSQRSKITIVPMETIFENVHTDVSDETIHAELNDLLTTITRCPKETTALLLRINDHDYAQLLKGLLPGSVPSDETERAQKELLKKKTKLEATLEKIINQWLSSSTELKKTQFTAKKLIALMHAPRFWDKKMSYQISLVIEECIKR